VEGKVAETIQHIEKEGEGEGEEGERGDKNGEEGEQMMRREKQLS
jgi:hypothetical protein